MSVSPLAPPPPAADPYLGLIFGGEFRIEAKIGAGGMGSVYRAVQQITERNVAIKVLHRHLYDETLHKRFIQEAQIISKLSHPNIVTVYKYGQHEDGTLFIAMECLEGASLDKVVQKNRGLELDRGLPLMVQMADALAYAHDQKIVHRDIKLENVVVTRTGRSEAIKVLDFGIAKILDNTSKVTKTGMICGSPMYMPPEQWQQIRDIDGRTDIYSLGCVLYAMVTGRLPFDSDSTLGYMMAHLQQTPKPPIELTSSLALVPELSDIIVRCIKRDRNDRYPDAYSLVEALRLAQVRFDASRLNPGASGRMVAAPIGVETRALTPPAAEASAPAAPGAVGAAAGPSAARPAGDDPHVTTPVLLVSPPAAAPATGPEPMRVTSHAAAAPAPANGNVPPAGAAREVSQAVRLPDLATAPMSPSSSSGSRPAPPAALPSTSMHTILVATGSLLILALAVTLILLQ